MLNFFLDSALTIPAGSTAPKKFLVPLAGMTKSTTVYLGDPYQTFLSVPAAIAATTLTVDDVSEFFPAGQAKVGTQTATYTSIVGNQLQGVTGVATAATAGTIVRPMKTWVGGPQNVFYSSGADVNSIGVALRVTGTPSFNFPGMPLILATSNIVNGGTPLSIDVQITVPAGPLATFSDWNITSSSFFPQTTGSLTTPLSTAIGISAILAGNVLRQDQQLTQTERILPVNRSIASSLPGFQWGTYRWRAPGQINQNSLIPSNWSIDPFSVGAEKFIAGIGAKDDLKPIGITQTDDSIHLEVNRGHYFTGINGYYLPATPQLDFLPANSTTLNLTKTPQQTIPIFVGTYQLDAQGYYEKATGYRYKTAAAVARGTDLPDLYYTLNRAANTITLSKAMDTQALYLGPISGQPTDYFSLPIYPVGNVSQVYVQAAAGALPTIATNWTYDEDLGTITIVAPSGAGVSVPGTFQGMAVLIVVSYCTPGSPHSQVA